MHYMTKLLNLVILCIICIIWPKYWNPYNKGTQGEVTTKFLNQTQEVRKRTDTRRTHHVMLTIQQRFVLQLSLKYHAVIRWIKHSRAECCQKLTVPPSRGSTMIGVNPSQSTKYWRSRPLTASTEDAADCVGREIIEETCGWWAWRPESKGYRRKLVWFERVGWIVTDRGS